MFTITNARTVHQMLASRAITQYKTHLLSTDSSATAQIARIVSRGLNHIAKELDCLSYILVADRKSDAVGCESWRAVWNNKQDGHCVVQDHSTAPILVPIAHLYATFYWWIILTYVLSRTVSELSRRIAQIIAFDRECFYLTLSFEVKRNVTWETRNITLSCGVQHISMYRTVQA